MNLVRKKHEKEEELREVLFLVKGEVIATEGLTYESLSISGVIEIIDRSTSYYDHSSEL